jgi:Uma2 family endonuclease
MVTHEKFYTADDLWELSQLSENDDKRYELIEGVLIEMSPAGNEHGLIAGNWFGHIWSHVFQNNLGYVTAAETGYILYKNPNGKDTVLAPDVGFYVTERAQGKIYKRFAPFPPDLAVEVASPSESGDEIQHKIQTYLRYGTRMVVYVYPKSQTVNVHTPSGVQTLDIDGTFDGGDVLPGFTLAVRDIFPKDAV